MAQALERLVVDCSVVVKWKITAEPYADNAEELFLDWRQQAVELCAPNLLQSAITQAGKKRKKKKPTERCAS